jgi:hypothetical protein
LREEERASRGGWGERGGGRCGGSSWGLGSMRAAAGMKRDGYDGARRERWIRFSVKIDRGDPWRGAMDGRFPGKAGYRGRWS